MQFGYKNVRLACMSNTRTIQRR